MEEHAKLSNSALEYLLQILERLDSMDSRIGRIERRLSQLYSVPDFHSNYSSEATRMSEQESHDSSRSPTPAEFALDGIIGEYHRAYEDISRRVEFERRFRPLRLGITNREQRFQNLFTSPRFGELAGGGFLAIEEPSTGNYFIFPHYSLTVNRIMVDEWSAAFDVEEINKSSTQSLFVTKPAMFGRIGTEFQILRKGSIQAAVA